MNGKIGIFGGSFNPIHIGHLHLAESARIQFGLERVIFIPTGANPFKFETAPTNDVLERKNRYKMVTLAIASNPFFEVSPIEINRTGKTYTIDTIQKIREQYPDKELFFIAGADIVFNITKWRKIDALFKQTAFIVAERPGYPTFKLRWAILRLRKRYRAMIYPMMLSGMDITSTDIRKRIREGKSVRYLIPDDVNAYIQSKNLYR
ncbi:nicotinate-nucleotide adenylyltransferase [Pseudoramibacter porci]|uniref:Probable nicotinate-nucleotide adenylyltransferase n=1 Tax=Pseudoramibacter porci TaxID=2606631 RepID=A0A7X2NG11_9FIRM|nr:nicotinate-nucleotide adenylyltransferase [Pseudoramibacter porci]MSS19872.1 nicotinate-nucleotide adenylyltransferase [Pseudoramibacter porci]